MSATGVHSVPGTTGVHPISRGAIVYPMSRANEVHSVPGTNGLYPMLGTTGVYPTSGTTGVYPTSGTTGTLSEPTYLPSTQFAFGSTATPHLSATPALYPSPFPLPYLPPPPYPGTLPSPPSLHPPHTFTPLPHSTLPFLHPTSLPSLSPSPLTSLHPSFPPPSLSPLPRSLPSLGPSLTDHQSTTTHISQSSLPQATCTPDLPDLSMSPASTTSYGYFPNISTHNVVRGNPSSALHTVYPFQSSASFSASHASSDNTPHIPPLVSRVHGLNRSVTTYMYDNHTEPTAVGDSEHSNSFRTNNGKTSGGQTPSSSTFGGHTPSCNTFGGQTPSSNTFGGQTPSSNTFVGQTPSSNNFGGQTPSSNSFGGQTNYTFGGQTPSSSTFGGQTNYTFGGQTPSSSTFGGQTPSSNTFGDPSLMGQVSWGGAPSMTRPAASSAVGLGARRQRSESPPPWSNYGPEVDEEEGPTFKVPRQEPLPSSTQQHSSSFQFINEPGSRNGRVHTLAYLTNIPSGSHLVSPRGGETQSPEQVAQSCPEGRSTAAAKVANSSSSNQFEVASSTTRDHSNVNAGRVSVSVRLPLHSRQRHYPSRRLESTHRSSLQVHGSQNPVPFPFTNFPSFMSSSSHIQRSGQLYRGSLTTPHSANHSTFQPVDIANPASQLHANQSISQPHSSASTSSPPVSASEQVSASHSTLHPEEQSRIAVNGEGEGPRDQGDPLHFHVSSDSHGHSRPLHQVDDGGNQSQGLTPTTSSSYSSSSTSSSDQHHPFIPTTDESGGPFQLVPSVPRGRGFSLSVAIGDQSGRNTIDLNLDVSGIASSSTESANPSVSSLAPSVAPSSSHSSPPTAVTISPTSPPSPPSPPSLHLHLPSEPGTSGLGSRREEVIIVDSSDDEDDHHVIMFTHRHNTPHRYPADSRYGNSARGRREASQISRDEVLARHLQAQFDREVDVPVSADAANTTVPPHVSVVPRPLQVFPSLSSFPTHPVSASGDSNLWSSRGPSGAIPPMPHIPTTGSSSHNPDISQIHSNYHALASHMRRITPTDAHRLLHVASLSGHSTVGRMSTRRRLGSRLDANRSIIFNAIMGRNSSYEELLELAERLGPAHSRGLTREEINKLPSRTHRKKDGDDKSCVVCMCEFQGRERIRTLKPCDHDFHQKCIDRWLKDHNTCPICRVIVSAQTTS